MPQVEECSICFNQIDIEKRTMLTCRHIFCSPCINRWLYVEKRDSCPLCRKKISNLKEDNQQQALAASPSQPQRIAQSRLLAHPVNPNQLLREIIQMEAQPDFAEARQTALAISNFYQQQALAASPSQPQRIAQLRLLAHPVNPFDQLICLHTVS